jgi:hypothetical protein
VYEIEIMDVSLNTSREYVSTDLKHVLAEAGQALEKCILHEDEVRDSYPDDGSNDCNLSTSVLNTTSMSNSSFDVTQAKCRSNPADLYSSFEAKEIALDENHHWCPDHNDSCECWKTGVVPVFNLEQEFSEFNRDVSKGGDDEKAKSPHQSFRSGSIDEMNGGGWDTTFDDHNFKITANQSVQDEDSCVHIGEIDLSNSLVEEVECSAVDGNLKGTGFTSHKEKDLFLGSTAENRDLFRFSSLHDDEQFFPQKTEEEVSQISYDEDDDEAGYFMSFLPNQGTDIFGESSKPLLDQPKPHSKDATVKDGSKNKRSSRKRTIPRSPHLITKQIFGEKHYSSIGVPRVITLEKPPEISSWKNRPLTVPIGPKLACEERFGRKSSPSKTSRFGSMFRRKKDEEKDEYIRLADSKRFVNKKTGRLLRSKVSAAKVEREQFKPTVPIAPKLQLTSKNGKKKYSCAGSHKDNQEEEIKTTVKEWGKNWKPTRPVSPRLSLNKDKYKTSTQSNSEHEDDEKVFTVRAQPIPQGVLNSNKGALKLPKVEKRGATIPKPFKFRMEKRSEIPALNVEDEPYVPFRARSVPDFLHESIAVYNAPQKKAQLKLTIPKPFKLRTEERASAPIRSETVEHSIKPFKARPFSDCKNGFKVLSKAPYIEKKKPTIPMPFKLSTEERANTPATSEETDHSFKPFKARPVPDFSRQLKVRVKEEKRLTIPKPFRLSCENSRREGFLDENNDTCSTGSSTKGMKGKSTETFHLRTDERGSKWSKKKKQQSVSECRTAFKARPLPDLSNKSNHKVKDMRSLTVPKPFNLSSFESTSFVKLDHVATSKAETIEKTDSIGTKSEFQSDENGALDTNEDISGETSFALRSATLAVLSKDA